MLNLSILKFGDVKPLLVTSTVASILALQFACATRGPVKKTYQSSPSPTPTSLNSPYFNDLKSIQALYQQGEFDKALRKMEVIPENKLTSPERAELWNLHGLIYLTKKQAQVSESSFQKALNNNEAPSLKGYYQYNLAIARYEQKKDVEALAVLNQIDLNALDTSRQSKVIALKDRLTMRLGPKATAETTGTTGVIEPSTQQPSEIINNLKQVYSGPVIKNKIGVLIPLSGKYESFGTRVREAVETAFQAEDPTHQYELIFEDSGDQLTTGQLALKKLVEQHEVIAILGPILSKDLSELNQTAEHYQVPLISLAQTQQINSPYLFSCSISNKNQISRIVQYATGTLNYKNFAVLAPKNLAGNEMAQLFWDAVEAHQGKVVGFEQYEPSATDFRDPVDKILGLYYKDARSDELKELEKTRKEMNITKKTRATAQYFNLKPIIDFDAVFIADVAKTAGQIIPTFAYRDAETVKYLGISSWNSNQLVARAKNFAEGAVFPVGYNPLSQTASTQSFIQKYQAKTGNIPGEIESTAYDASLLVLQTLKDKPSSREDFKSTLEKITRFEGTTGNTEFSDHQCTRELSLYQVEKGKIVPLKN